MKERLEAVEKSLLLLIPYLIVLSLSYYLGYWGYFGIDAISYYGVQDLIKGFAYALPAVVAVGIIFIVINVLIGKYVSFLRGRFNKLVAPLLFGIPYVTFFFLYISNKFPEVVGEWVFPIIDSIFIITILDSVTTVMGWNWDWAIENSKSFLIMKWLTLFCIICFFSSYTYGKNKANSISQNKYFAYSRFASAPDSVGIIPTLKYLGKAGDYYFFISLDNKEKHIITVQTIPNLVLHDYDKDDSVSVRAYRSFVKHKQSSPTP